MSFIDTISSKINIVQLIDGYAYCLIYVGFYGLLVLANGQASQSIKRVMYGVFAVALTIIIGLRFEVGGDWHAYIRFFEYDNAQTLTQALTQSEPLRRATSIVFQTLGLNGLDVNLVYSAVFAFGLSALLYRLPHSAVVWLAVCPIFVFLVAMGFMRQSLVVGLLALLAITRTHVLVTAMAVAVVSFGFQMTSAPISALVVLMCSKRWWLSAAMLALGGVALFLLWDSVWFKLSVYLNLDGQIQTIGSAGAIPRTTLIALGCVGVLMSTSKSLVGLNAYFPFRVLAVLSVILIPVALFYSTLADRMAMYLMPVFCIGISAWCQWAHARIGGYLPLIVTSVYGGAFVVWLLFSVKADHWVPFRLHGLTF